MPKVSIVIPNFNGKKFLENCLKSIQSSVISHQSSIEIIVVDNGSTDGSVGFVKKKFPKVKTIRLDKNYGFAKAVNEGIKASRGEYVALLNNDTKVDKNWLSELVKAAKENPKISVFASNILSWNGKKIDSQGIEFFWRGKAEQINQGKIYNPQPTTHNSQLIFGACAAAALYRKEIFEKLGYFDEDFFAYLEDVDFSLRVHLAEEKCLFAPKAIVYHCGGATRKRMGNFKARMDAKNWIFIIVKDYPIGKFIRYFPQIFIERLRNLSGLIKQTVWWQVPWAIFATYGEVLLKLPKIIWKRRF